jgi:hypothetical protein
MAVTYLPRHTARRCAAIIWVDIDQRISSSFPIPLLPSSEISFFEQGWLDDLRIGADPANWDAARPDIAITTPRTGQQLSNAVATVSGTAKDNMQVADVFYRVGTDSWKPASSTNGWTNWMATP